MAFKVPNKYRIRDGRAGSSDDIGNAGAFAIKLKHGQQFFAIASDGLGWEHVSVSRSDRCPTWDEMCQVKELFWDDSDCVVQYHPPKSQYVNNHPYCLHLWRQAGSEFPAPATILVGVKRVAA